MTKLSLCIAVVVALLLTGCWRQNDAGRSYYESGKIRTEAIVKNGVLDGPATMFYESGKKMSEATYRAGVLDGKAVSYYESGAKKSAAEYKGGVLNGTSASWKEDGSVVDEVTFADGRLLAKEDNATPGNKGAGN